MYKRQDYDFYSDELTVVEERAFSDGERAACLLYTSGAVEAAQKLDQRGFTRAVDADN